MKIPFWSLSEQAEETVLIDSGATENFLDKDIWQKMRIGSYETVKPITVYNVDRTENSQGKITHYCWLQIWYDRRQKLQHFYIAALEKESIILGYLFLYTFNRTIDWQRERYWEICTSKPHNINISIATSLTCRRKQSKRQATQRKERPSIVGSKTIAMFGHFWLGAM